MKMTYVDFEQMAFWPTTGQDLLFVNKLFRHYEGNLEPGAITFFTCERAKTFVLVQVNSLPPNLFPHFTWGGKKFAWGGKEIMIDWVNMCIIKYKHKQNFWEASK